VCWYCVTYDNSWQREIKNQCKQFRKHVHIINNKTICCILSFEWFPGVWILRTDVSKYSVLSSYVVFLLTPPMKMEQTGCSETSAHKIQKPRNYSKERIQHSEHSESLKSRTDLYVLKRMNCKWPYLFTVFQRNKSTATETSSFPFPSSYSAHSRCFLSTSLSL